MEATVTYHIVVVGPLVSAVVSGRGRFPASAAPHVSVVIVVIAAVVVIVAIAVPAVSSTARHCASSCWANWWMFVVFRTEESLDGRKHSGGSLWQDGHGW